MKVILLILLIIQENNLLIFSLKITLSYLFCFLNSIGDIPVTLLKTLPK